MKKSNDGIRGIPDHKTRKYTKKYPAFDTVNCQAQDMCTRNRLFCELVSVLR